MSAKDERTRRSGTVLLFAAIVLLALTQGCSSDKSTNPPDGTTNQSPEAPSNPVPANVATEQSTSTTLSWQCSDADNDPLAYDIAFGQANPPGTVASGLTAQNYQPSSLMYNSVYYWRVTAHDDHDHTTLGPVWSFSTQARQSGIHIVGQIGSMGNTQNVTVSGTRAYIYNDASGGTSNFVTADITDPVHPARLSSGAVSQRIYSVSVDNSRAFLSLGTDGMLIENVSSSMPSQIGILQGHAISSARAVGTYVYACGGQFMVIDIVDPSTPVVVGVASAGGTDIAVAGHYAYVAGMSGQPFRIIDLSSPTAPVIVSSYALPSPVDVTVMPRIALSDNSALVADGKAGLQILDISNVQSPARLAVLSTDTFHGIMDVAVSGNYAFIAEGSRMRVIDISVPSQPVVVATYTPAEPVSYYVNGLDVVGNYAYIAAGAGGLPGGLVILEFVP